MSARMGYAAGTAPPRDLARAGGGDSGPASSGAGSLARDSTGPGWAMQPGRSGRTGIP